MYKCRPGLHDSWCGLLEHAEECNCGCSPSDWCDMQADNITGRNWFKYIKACLNQLVWIAHFQTCRHRYHLLDHIEHQADIKRLKQMARNLFGRTTHV